MDGLGSASPPVAPTATTGEGRHPCTWPRTFWFKPLSAFGLLDLTTFISSSPELAMPSTLAPNRLSASSRRALSREARPPWVGEVTLSQELRTARSPRPHVLVGYQWSHTGLRPGRKTSHNRYIRSFVSHPPQIRTCETRNSCCHISSIHLPSAYNRVFGTSPVGRMGANSGVERGANSGNSGVRSIFSPGGLYASTNSGVTRIPVSEFRCQSIFSPGTNSARIPVSEHLFAWHEFRCQSVFSPGGLYASASTNSGVSTNYGVGASFTWRTLR